MSITQTFRGKAETIGAVNPTIYNVVVANAATEESQALSAKVKAFTIRVRGIANLQFAYVSTESGTKFITVPKGSSYSKDNLNFTGTLYFQTDEDSQVVEIEEWV